ncbi:hypothetical protein [Vagococcus fluvialis]|uniref:hypothetical protein n=1 Tax=Vagococcus fluvialis TaxID=2738 RepID=UPI0022E0E3FA|nr:hypothetical protein [Vagococcus fluvialis]WNF91031.1 hypothetical protein QDW48_04790 [Vagococcus fluvialis]
MNNRNNNSIIFLLVLLFCPIIILLFIGGAFIYMIPIFIVAYFISNVSVEREFRKKEKEAEEQRLEKELRAKLEKEKEIKEKENQIKRVVENNRKINDRVDFLLSKVDEMKLQSMDESELNFDNDIKYLIELFYIIKVFRLPTYFDKDDAGFRSCKCAEEVFCFWLSLRPQISVEMLKDFIPKTAYVSVIAAIADSIKFKESFEESRIYIGEILLGMYLSRLDLSDLSRFGILDNSSFSDILENSVSEYLDILTAKKISYWELAFPNFDDGKSLTKEESIILEEVSNRMKTLRDIENELSKEGFEYIMEEREDLKSDIIGRVVRKNVTIDKFAYDFQGIFDFDEYHEFEDENYRYALKMSEDDVKITAEVNSSIDEIKNVYINDDELKEELDFSYLDVIRDNNEPPYINEAIAERTEKDSIDYSSSKIKEFHNNYFEYHGSSDDMLTKLQNPNYAVEFKNNLAKNGLAGNFELFLSDIYNDSIKNLMSNENWKSKLIEIIEEIIEEVTEDINEEQEEIDNY